MAISIGNQSRTKSMAKASAQACENNKQRKSRNGMKA